MKRKQVLGLLFVFVVLSLMPIAVEASEIESGYLTFTISDEDGPRDDVYLFTHVSGSIVQGIQRTMSETWRNGDDGLMHSHFTYYEGEQMMMYFGADGYYPQQVGHVDVIPPMFNRTHNFYLENRISTNMSCTLQLDINGDWTVGRLMIKNLDIGSVFGDSFVDVAKAIDEFGTVEGQLSPTMGPYLVVQTDWNQYMGFHDYDFMVEDYNQLSWFWQLDTVMNDPDVVDMDEWEVIGFDMFTSLPITNFTLKIVDSIPYHWQSMRWPIDSYGEPNVVINSTEGTFNITGEVFEYYEQKEYPTFLVYMAERVETYQYVDNSEVHVPEITEDIINQIRYDSIKWTLIWMAVSFAVGGFFMLALCRSEPGLPKTKKSRKMKDWKTSDVEDIMRRQGAHVIHKVEQKIDDKFDEFFGNGGE